MKQGPIITTPKNLERKKNILLFYPYLVKAQEITKYLP